MKKATRFLQGTALLIALASAGANAHEIWIEQDAKSTRFYFGEFNDNLREVSPGLLDKFAQPVATHLSAKGERSLTLDKTAGAFVLNGRAGKNESIVVEDPRYPIFERKTDGQKAARTFWTPAARYVTDLVPQAPKLALDIVPTGQTGEFKLFFKGQPLPKTKVGIVALSGWSKEARTDEYGIVRFSTPWKGAYLMEARHTDNTPGERDGETYDVASYGTTLSFVQPKGLLSPPAPPAAKPNK